MVYFGLEPGVAVCKAQMNPLRCRHPICVNTTWIKTWDWSNESASVAFLRSLSQSYVI